MADKALADFEEDDAPQTNETNNAAQQGLGVGLGTHSAVALGGFKDFCLKKDLTRAITDNGFEHPSEVQHQALPRATLGSDILAQAKSGMGKTAVFVFALLEQIEPSVKGVQAIVLVHARELAYQIDREFKRFNKYLPHCQTVVFFGGMLEEENVNYLKSADPLPTVIVGTPGRMKSLIEKKHIDCSDVKFFVVDEFDQCLSDIRMRRDVQTIFLATPKEKQVMMFSATMSEELRNTARKFMSNPTEIYVDQQSKLTLHGLTQFFVDLTEAQKLRKLMELLDYVEFNQCIIFVNKVARCEALNRQLQAQKFPSMGIHSSMDQKDRLSVYENCKKQTTRIVVSTDLFGRGIDIDRINFVVQFDMAQTADMYLHRVGRAGRFGTKGLTVAFLTQDEQSLREAKWKDHDIMKEVQERFEMKVQSLTDHKQLDQSQYMNQ